MIDPVDLSRALLLSIPAGILFTAFAGLNRIPWRYALEFGVGSASILALSNLATASASPPFEPGQLVLVGASLGGPVVRAYERGMAIRRAEIDRILAFPDTTQS